MQLQRFVDALKADLTAVAELGDESTAEAAGREGVSVNTWIVRALSRSSTAAPAAQSGNRLTGYARG